MGKDNELILSNLRFISERGARIYIRIPVIGGVNDTEEEMEAMITFLKSIYFCQPDQSAPVS